MEEEEYSKPTGEEHSKPSGEEYSKPSGEGHGHRAASNTELMESAKMVAGAAQSAFQGKTDSIDKARVAGAAEDLLGAAQQYGNLDGSGIGQYVDKAEDYLHKYHASNSEPAGAGGESENHAPVSDRREEEKEEKESGAGVGDYLNIAKGFFK